MDHPASDGVRLRLHEWSGSGAPVASMLVLHGVAEHGGRYAGLGSELAARDVETLAFDHRGHGESGGDRVHVNRWERYLEDGWELVARLADRAPGRPLFVYGHSMGSLICLGMAMERRPGNPVSGWIVSGVGIEPAGIAKPHLVAIARLLSRIAPKVTLDIGLDPEAMSRDEVVVEAYRSDPLVQRRATVRWGAEALRSIAEIKAGAHVISDPLLILHGGDDPLSLPTGSRWLARTASGETTLKIYDGCLHEPHNDSGFDAAGDIADWIEAHVGETHA